MGYLVGVDGGGTKTAFAVAKGTGEVVATHTLPGSSYREIGVEGVAGQLSRGLDHCLAMVGADRSQLVGVCAGLPCIGEDSRQDRRLFAALETQLKGLDSYITNDVEVGWWGSLAGESGINIVSGTGSIGYGRNNFGHSARSGGWSEFFGDEGSCYWAGIKVLELFSKQADGRLPKAALYHLVRQQLALTDDFELIRVVDERYAGARHQVASLQLYLEQAALEGDETAQEVYRQVAQELALLVEGVAGQLQFSGLGQPFPVSYSGGMFRAGELVLAPFRSRVEQLGGVLQTPRLSPVEGAVLCAFHHFAPDAQAQALQAVERAAAGNSGTQ